MSLSMLAEMARAWNEARFEIATDSIVNYSRLDVRQYLHDLLDVLTQTL